MSSQGSPGPARTVPDVLAGRYHLEEQIGAGGAGTVWRASDAALGRHVAVKLLHPALDQDPDTVARFRREATAAAKLTHPNAVVIYDIGEESGRVYLVMELVGGPTLGDLLARGPLPPVTVGCLGLQVARALGDAHARGLVHRDVKPANVLLTVDGSAKVADFGIAKALGAAQTRLTTPGTVVGTAAYLAPEQLGGEGRIDARADVYALGLVLYECLTGDPPFIGGTAVEVATRRLAGDPPPLDELRTDVPGDLQAIIHRATRRDADDRFPDGSSLAATLEPLVPAHAMEDLARLVRERGRAGLVAGGGSGTSVLPGAETGAAATREVSDRGARGEDPNATSIVAPTATSAPHRPPVEPEQAPQPPGNRRGPDRRWVLAGVVGALGLALVLLLGSLGGDPGSEVRDRDPTGGEDGAAQTAAIEVADAQDYDPFGDDGEEHPDEVDNAIDGDPATAWTTSGYNSADFGGLKQGAGMWFDLGDTQDVGQVTLQLTSAGVDFEIYASDDTPDDDDLEPWGEPVANQQDAGSDTQVEVSGDARGRYWLVWFTSLPDDGGRHRAGLADVQFRAR